MSVKPFMNTLDKLPVSERKQGAVVERWDGDSGERSIANLEHLP